MRRDIARCDFVKPVRHVSTPHKPASRPPNNPATEAVFTTVPPPCFNITAEHAAYQKTPFR